MVILENKFQILSTNKRKLDHEYRMKLMRAEGLYRQKQKKSEKKFHKRANLILPLKNFPRQTFRTTCPNCMNSIITEKIYKVKI